MDNSCKNNKITENEQQLIDTVAKITDNYRNSELLCLNKTMRLPSRNEIIGIIKDLRRIISRDISRTLILVIHLQIILLEMN